MITLFGGSPKLALPEQSPFVSKTEVQPLAGKIALITGANVGIGKDVARQLALSGTYERIYLGCRNRAKADLAKRDLELSTGTRIFEIVLMDVSDPASVRAVLASLPEPIDALVMNAGGSGGKMPLAVGEHGVTAIFASNLLGHVVLLEGLIDAGKLKGTALLVGSEAARGVPKLGMKRPSLPTSSTEEFASLCDGTFFRDREADGKLAYGQVKYVGAMWMAAVARRNPKLRLLTMSPGNTRGTEGLRDLPQPLRFLMKYVLAPVVMPLRGMIHDLDQGAKRLVDGLADDTLASGAFYASKADALIGPVVDQSEIFPDLANTVYQDHAYEAVHRFI
jgi:NAD(P)-dependent dehydrogenase (short-subunit alcohol dehydrogenase family)